MADKSNQKPSGEGTKHGSDTKRFKKHKRSQSDVTEVKLDLSSAIPEQFGSDKLSATPEEFVMPTATHHANNESKKKKKKKSAFRHLSFGKRKKTDSNRKSGSDFSDSQLSSSTEAGYGELGNIADKSTGTGQVLCDGEDWSGERVQDDEERTLSPDSRSEELPSSASSIATSLTVVSAINSEVNDYDRMEKRQESDLENQSEHGSNPEEEDVVRIDDIPSDTDVAEGKPQPSRDSTANLVQESQETEPATDDSSNSVAETVFIILSHLKAVAFGGDKLGHVSGMTSETYKLGVIALDQSFAKFEGLFNFLLNQAEETTRKIVLYFLASLIKRYPHCFKVCKVKRKKGKSEKKLVETNKEKDAIC